MLTSNTWRCTAQAFSVGIWAKDPLGPKYQFYQNTYCLSKDISNRTPLRFVISNKQIRSRFLDMKLFNNAKETGHSHLKVTINTMFKVLVVTESFAWRCVLLCVSISPLHCDQDRVMKKERPRENSLFFPLIIMTVNLVTF